MIEEPKLRHLKQKAFRVRSSILELVHKALDFIPERFRDQVALVVGGAQGIGNAIAVRLAKEGATVVISDIDRHMMKGTVQEIGRVGGKSHALACDVRKRRQVEQMVHRLIRRHAKIDVLMYVAGVGQGISFVETGEEQWDCTLDVNLKGAFLVARNVAPHMVKQRHGKMVFMASTNSWDAEAELAPYNASKACPRPPSSCSPRRWPVSCGPSASTRMPSVQA